MWPASINDSLNHIFNILRLLRLKVKKKMRIELIPSAKRLIKSLRDIGYEFVDAVADIVDNSVEGQATVINITLNFDGENSYLTIADNGIGMTSKEIQESLRFGSNRTYAEADDLGRYGLGLKTASLSQCERLTVSSRRGEERARFNSFCWDLDHIEKTNRWEILKVENEDLKDQALNHLNKTTGTVITWERLSRLMGYKYPYGEYAKKQSEQMANSLKTHLGMVFHRFLSGEVKGKRIAIYINDQRIVPWDPYSRGETHTQEIKTLSIPIVFNNYTHDIIIRPFILPPQSLFSSTKAHLLASGPGKWNKQQGLYIYRANRIIQPGGWNGLRTSDEHTKLVRIAVFIPSQLDELFQVNVAKKHLTLPRELRTNLLKEIQPIIQRAQEVYREKTIEPVSDSIINLQINSSRHVTLKAFNESEKNSEILSSLSTSNSKYLSKEDPLAKRTASRAGFHAEYGLFLELIRALFDNGDEYEKRTLEKLLEKYLSIDNSKNRSAQNI
jgi:hypothetical protein